LYCNILFVRCSWTFWSEVYHQGLLDELRIWDTVRTQAQIRDAMFTSIQKEDHTHLAGYWSFESYVGDGGDALRPHPDLSGHNHDLHPAGCAECNDFNAAYIPVLQKLECVPSAKSEMALYYRGTLAYGGAHCYGDKDHSPSGAVPARIPSGAPIGGFTFPQMGTALNATIDIVLNATDPDHDALTFGIMALPADAEMKLFWRSGLADGDESDIADLPGY
jgi:hypothetical protein